MQSATLLDKEKLHQIDWAGAALDPVMTNLRASLASPIVNGKNFPGFPVEELQQQVNGSFGETALLEAYPFYKRILGYASLLDIEVGAEAKVLDLGCGWGRHLRFFWQIVNPENLYGADIDQSFVDLCKNLFPSGNFTCNSPEPPLPYPDNSFDIVWSYSVFSHLNQEYNLMWMREVSRVLKPGGMFILTTQGRDFIKFCDSFRGKTSFDCRWFELLSTIFQSDATVDEAKRNFERGQFQYFSIGGGGGPRDASFYGEAVVPKKFFVDNWSEHFQIFDFCDPRCDNQQAIIVAQKIRGASP